MSEYKNWQLEIGDRIATLTLNRPDQSNNLTPETFYELREITKRLAEDKDVWVVLVQGKGAHFSIGMDVEVIGQVIGLDETIFRETLMKMQSCMDEFEALEKPTIAKIQGFCLGGGMILALGCDFRIASRRSVFGFPEVKRGVPVIMGTQRVTQIVGPAVAKDLILLGRNLRAHTAGSLGLVHKIVDPEKLDKAADAFTKKFLSLPPRTIGAAKRIINQSQYLSLRAAQDLEIEVQTELIDSADFKEAIDSFFENRSPVFRGE